MRQDGKSYAEIAAALELHPNRIYTYITLIRTKGYSINTRKEEHEQRT